MLGTSWLAQDVLGSTTLVAGLAATAAGTLSISIAAGRVYEVANTDTSSVASGDLPADLIQILQQGAAAAQSVLLSTAGLTAGQSRWALIEAGFQQADVIATGDPNGGLLNFYNVNDPSQPLQGPANNFLTLPTARQGQCSIRVIYGAVATTGSEVPPTADSGFVGLYLIDLAFGQTVVTQPNIKTAGPLAGTGVVSTYPQAPFIPGLIMAGQYCQDVGAANAYVIGVVGGRQTGQPIRVKIGASNANTGAATLQDGSGAAALVNADGSALIQGQLKGNGVYQVVFDGTSYQLISPSSGQPRIRLSANLDMYVATTGSNANNTGLTIGSPFQTAQFAANRIQNGYDLNGFVVTVHMAAGTYAAGAILNGAVPGQSAPTSIAFDSAAGAVTINAAGVAFGANQGAMFALTGNNWTITASLSGGVGNAISVGGGSKIAINGIINYGTCATDQVIAATGGQVLCSAVETISGGAQTHFRMHAGGLITANAIAVTLTGTPAFSGAYVSGDECGILEALAYTITSGTATGTRYSATTNSVINTAGGGANFFPGSIAGAVATGGQYV